jgi:P27 family predicted phage terminase small subunit
MTITVERGLPPAPKHLSQEAAQWWRDVVSTYVLAPHHLKLLRAACEAFDRMEGARTVIASDGMTVPTAHGMKAHPLLAVERDARLALARLIRELDLDTEPPASARIAPPALFSNNGGRRARKAADS